VSWRFDGLADALDPSFGVGKSTFLFSKAGGRQNDISQPSCFRQKNILDY